MIAQKKVFLRSDGNYDTNKASDESGLECKDKSLTQQHLAEETDINYIVKRYQQTGEVPQHQLPPLQGDFADAPDFEQAQNLLVQAREAFDALPSAHRTQFHNDPREYVEFMSDPKNKDKIREMGLFNEEAMARWTKQQEAAKAAQAALEADAAAHRATKDTKGATPPKKVSPRPVT